MACIVYVPFLLALTGWTTPIWCIPFRRLIERLGYPRTRSGRVVRANLVNWLGATGVGIFVGSVSMLLAQGVAKFA
jgi:hypothetical protein